MTEEQHAQAVREVRAAANQRYVREQVAYRHPVLAAAIRDVEQVQPPERAVRILRALRRPSQAGRAR